MESHLLPIFTTFLALALVATHAALPPQLYWKSVLPNTPMPKTISDLLNPDWTEDKGTTVNVGKGGVNVNAGHGKPGGTNVNVGKGGVNVNTGKGKPGGTNVNVGHGGVNMRQRSCKIPLSCAKSLGLKERISTLESMVDFSICKLGKNVQAIVTEAEPVAEGGNWE
ncbi:hypothetical protein L6164_024166 [Bauhinia variegata]|uniref:Uncharacterized protein n=1 Tax=Bauhinia variegata TaxID=167791 RepID=A0ACB9LZ04_BAUVA|nr:hypothetical protein L6164_024166 [Bauhinia variegata]